MGLMVDTDVFIRVERSGDPVGFRRLGRDREMVMSAITASELLIGVYRADTSERQARRRMQIEAFLAELPIISFTTATARVHARAKHELQQRGLVIGAHDLIIAATALEHGHDVLTGNVREFERIDGLKVIAFPNTA